MLLLSTPVRRGTLTAEWFLQDFHLSALHSTSTWGTHDAGAKKVKSCRGHGVFESAAARAMVLEPAHTPRLEMAPCLKQYHGRQWRTSTRQKPVHCDIWTMVYDVLWQRTGQTAWSHQYGHNHSPFNDEADALAKQVAAATDRLQLRPCVLPRPGEPLAPSGPRNVQPKGNAGGTAEQQPISAPQP